MKLGFNWNVVILAALVLFVPSGATAAAGNGSSFSYSGTRAEEVTPGHQAVPCAGHRLPSVDQILERYIEAVGGREAIEKLETRVIKGRFIKDLHWDDPPYQNYRIVIFAEFRGGMLVDEHKPGGRRREGYDGKTNWVEDKNGVELRERIYIRKLAWICNPQGAVRVEQYFPDLSVNYEGSGEDSRFFVLESSELPNTHYSLYFEKKTGLLRRIGYYWDVKDYRKVDGVLTPHRVVTSRKGSSCTYEFEEVTNNAPLASSIFSSPGGAVD